VYGASPAGGTLARVTTGSVSFERIADQYDATRGGVARGERCVAEFAPYLSPVAAPHSVVLEVGVGTGAIALPLNNAGFDVVGIDLSPAMLSRAHERIGSRVAAADAHLLPFPDGSVDAVVTVWVLHVVGDAARVIGEIGRVIRPGGRYVVLCADAISGDVEGDDLEPILYDLDVAIGRYKDTPERVRRWADAAGLDLIEETTTSPFTFAMSPEECATFIEMRTGSSFWDLTDAQWEARVQPHLDRLRALPDPERKRDRALATPILVFERAV
jgi:ubiquinone/menaquinone biosynthesis C-methylase UbiE